MLIHEVISASAVRNSIVSDRQVMHEAEISFHSPITPVYLKNNLIENQCRFVSSLIFLQESHKSSFMGMEKVF